MNLITPEEARLTIRDTEDMRPDLLKSWRALETLANMHEEWGIVSVYLGRHEVEEWGFDTREEADAEGSAFPSHEYRIIRRYVTETEEIS